MSGWNETELQTVLDNCANGAFIPDSTKYCSQWLTHKIPVTEGVSGIEDETAFVSLLQSVAPPVVDVQATISPEEVNNVAEIPRGVCNGTLLNIPGNTVV